MTTSTVERASPETELLNSQDFVYCGRRLLVSGKLAIAVRPIAEDGTLQGERLFAFERKGHRSVGGVYSGARFTETQAAGLFSPQLKFMRRWQEADDRIEWEALDGAAEAADRARKMEADDKKVSDIEAAMIPLRAQFERFRHMRNRGGMEALRAAVLAALEAPLRPAEREEWDRMKAYKKRQGH
jgi:hypothetical protein